MPTTDPEPIPVLEALHSTPSRRYLADTPIPDAVLWAILDAAVRGPSGGNRQGWGWVVVTDAEIKRAVSGWYYDAWNEAYGRRRDEILNGPATPGGLSPRAFLATEHLAEHLAEAPVWVFAVLRHAADSTNPRLGSSIYGAVQQLMLAARAYGIGTTLTTLYAGHEKELAAMLGLPADAMTMALLPLGYPSQGHWSEPKRSPVEEVVHWNRWGDVRNRT